VTTISLSEQAYQAIRRMIVRLELAPGQVIREEELQHHLGIGRTPIREAMQRLVRDQFVTVFPRRGAFVSGVDVGELSMLYETRRMLEPYATRLACERGKPEHWEAMAVNLERAADPSSPSSELLEIDRACHEIIWAAAGNRFLTDTLDMLYAQSDRLWHMYLAEVADMDQAVAEHCEILEALAAMDADRSATLVEAHLKSFDDQIRAAVRERLAGR
jgi:DNA-binding GntR family transcriptional regulator